MPRGVGAAGQQPVAGERRRGEQPVVVAGKHRHAARRAAAADGHDDPAGAGADVGAAHVPQVGADQPRACAQAHQRAGPVTPRLGGLRIRQCQEPGDLGGRVRGPGPLAGQRLIRRVQVRDDLARDEPQVGAQGTAGRPGDARSVRGEPLDHRRVQQRLRRRIQAEADRPASKLACRPQQALGPVPARRRRRGHDGPGELARRRGDSWRGLPAGHIPSHVTRFHTALIL
jgi:hypothetical protein